jgi:hypothetical protein
MEGVPWMENMLIDWIVNMESNLENLFLKLYGKHPTNFNWCTQILEALREQLH